VCVSSAAAFELITRLDALIPGKTRAIAQVNLRRQKRPKAVHK
jgi:hypothetical protein